MALIGNITNRAFLQGQINDANGYLTGVISNAGLLGGQIVAERGLKGDKGETGDTGNGIASITKVSTVGLVDTYKIAYTNGTETTFTVTNGQDGHSPVITTERVGKTVTIYADGVAIGSVEDGVDGIDGQDGVGISSIVKTASVGLVDTYTITYTDSNTSTFTVTNGKDGVDGQDGADGQDGFSPSATVSKADDTVTITITDKDGTTTATVTDEEVKQLSANAPSYSYWRPLPVGESSSNTEGFTPSTKTGGTYTFPTLQAQPSTGTIRMGKASFFNGSYTHKVSPTTLTANRTATLPNKSGTIAFTSDIPPLVNDLGNIDPSEYEDDREVFLNTLLQDGIYRFVFEDGDDYEYYVVVESMLDNGYVYQEYWSSEEGSNILYHCSLVVEDGEVVDRSEENYMTLTEASNMFATKSHYHFESKNDAMAVLDWCDSNALTFDNTKPSILYTDTLNSKNWLIERYTTVRSPNFRFIRVYDMSDASHFYIRSGSVVGSTTTWGSWKEYKDSSAYHSVPSGGTTNQVLAKNSNTDYDLKWVNQSGGGGSVNDVEVNGTSVVSGGVADISISAVGLSNDYDDLDNLPTIPTKTSDLTNDALFARGHIGNFHGTCSTAAGTAAKVVTCADFKATDLVAGAIIVVSFDNTNSGAVADLTLNVNSTGAYHIKRNNAGTIGNLDSAGYIKASTSYMFYFDGTYWVITAYDTNTNTIGYTIRTNGLQLKTKTACYRYRLMFTSPDGQYFVPANSSTSTSSTASKTVTTEKIDPWGRIVYYGTTTAVASNSYPTASYLYQQYNGVALGYSFNRTGSALTMTNHYPVYVKATPQSDGSAIIDGTTPFVQALPSTEDGKIYIFLGIATAETTIEFTLEHPVYEYKGGKIRPYTNPDLSGKSDVGHTHTSTDITDFYPVFYAEYGVTSYQDVVEALTESRQVTVLYDAGNSTYIYAFNVQDFTYNGTNQLMFTAVKDNTEYIFYLQSDDTWQTQTISLADTSMIPTNTSDLYNDSGFITSESVTDVKVNSTSVMSGTVAEVTVPTKTSDLNNDSGFIARSSGVGSFMDLHGSDTTITLSTSNKLPAMSNLTDSDGVGFTHNTTDNAIECNFDGVVAVQGTFKVYNNYTAQDIIACGIYKNSAEAGHTHQFRVPPNMTAPNQNVVTPLEYIKVQAGDILKLFIRNNTGSRGVVQNEYTHIMARYI